MLIERTGITEHYELDSSGKERMVSKDVATETMFKPADKDGEVIYDDFDDEHDEVPSLTQVTIWALAVVFAGTLAANAISALLISL